MIIFRNWEREINQFWVGQLFYLDVKFKEETKNHA